LLVLEEDSIHAREAAMTATLITHGSLILSTGSENWDKLSE
jgi:hypothetical protein